MPNKSFGVTQPISDRTPTLAELKLTHNLVATLQEYGMYETPEKAQQRMSIIGHLTFITNLFIKVVIKKRNVKREWQNGRSIVLTAGSCHLGVQSNDSNINAACIVPRFTRRVDFYTEMVDILEDNIDISDIIPLPDVDIPVIKFKYNHIPVDFLFARLDIPTIPPDIDLNKSETLKGVAEKCMKSINSLCVEKAVLELIPNIETFQIVLRCIRLWAKQRGIFSSGAGYLGSTSWAILVARVCQLYPNATAGVVVQNFFHIFSAWDWKIPIVLRQISIKISKFAKKPLHMPIIIPVFPYSCISHSVTKSTKKVLISELKAASEKMCSIMSGQSPWSCVFQLNTFFNNYKLYLQITASADSHLDLKSWGGLVGENLRELVSRLDAVPVISLVQPYQGSFQTTSQDTSTAYSEIFYVGLYVHITKDRERILDMNIPSVTSWTI